MPIYEYHCPKCGTFELMQRITEAPVRKCPTCKGKVERLVSRTSFVLKGSGWYATDYARSSKSDSKETTSASTANGAASSKADSGSLSDTAKPSSSSETAKSSSSEKSAAK
jgi:putative FmdB family regulatory protein